LKNDAFFSILYGVLFIEKYAFLLFLSGFGLKYNDDGLGMKPLKNNALAPTSKKQLCKTHNGKSSSSQKVKLLIYKSCGHIKTYHPLKKKKIKLHRLKFIRDTTDYTFQMSKYDILSKRYCARGGKSDKDHVWNKEEEVINWLISINVKIKRLTELQFLLENKICSLNHVLVFANKRRVELGLSPFYVEGITEY
jgi:hypothetical protein